PSKTQRQPLEQPQEQSHNQPPKRGPGRPRKQPSTLNIDVYLAKDATASASSQFKHSQTQEVNGLIERDVFEYIRPCDLPESARILNSRFVDSIKNEGTEKAYKKSRLVIQAYNDENKSQVLTQSPTIQRVSQRIILAIAAICPELNVYLRDITQAYTQSTTKLNREFYVRPPPGIPQWSGIYLKVIKPLYGVPEAGNHWFSTYHKHHLEKLRMSQSTYDPCLLSVSNQEQFGIVGLQTDDTLILANPEFATAEESELKKAGFTSKPREQLTFEHPLKFNGRKVTLQLDGSILLTQEGYTRHLKPVSTSPADLVSSRGNVRQRVSIKGQYVAQRARGAYPATVSQPEAAFDLSFAAQKLEPQSQDITLLNKRI
ncbi:hypothetical protein HYALB_00013669, partial [Hymenoscyphus albidus]